MVEMSSGLEGIVRDSAAKQLTMHKLTGGIWIFLGAIFSVAIFVPGKADEEGARIAAAIFGVLSLAFGIGFIVFMKGRLKTLVELLLTRRSELKGAGIVGLRSRGTVIAYVISVRDSANRRYRMRVATEANARAMLAGIPG